MTLTVAVFGVVDAKLDVSAIGEEFFEQILEGKMAWFKTILFKTICFGTAYRPSAAPSRAKQVFKDDNGNKTRISTRVYFMNLMIGVSCMGRGKFEIDVATYAVDHMDPDIRAQLEASYSAHLSDRERDPLTQTNALQELLTAATKAEKSVTTTRNIASSNTTKILHVAFPNLKSSAITHSGATAGALVAGSQDKRTISANFPMGPVDWSWEHCVGCNSDSHRHQARGGNIICTHVGRLGC